VTDPVHQLSMAPANPKKRRGCLGLATRTVLGCAAFSFGAIVALVLCLPWMLGGPVRSVVESAFGEMYRGSLAVGDVDLSWWSEQQIQDAVLYDPDRREVARVSAVLPSLLDLMSMEGPMKVAVTLDADLSADDAGITNLQRAIEPRDKTPKPVETDDDEEGTDPLAQLSRLDLEVTLSSHKLTWSDAETRKGGKPFEIQSLSAALVLEPGQPITLKTSGLVVADSPGTLEIESTIHGPIEIGKSWPLGPVDAKVRIQGFSTAMVDGLASLQGKLVEVIGPKFDLRLEIDRATPQQGGIELEFESERTNLAFAGGFEGGLLRSRDGSPVRLVVGVPKGFVNDLLAPALPPGMSVTWEEGERPWSVSIANLALPIPEAGGDPTGAVDRILARLVADVDIDLPARVSFENAETKAAGVQPSIDGVRAQLHFAAGEPAKAHLETTLETGQRGRIVADATFGEAFRVRAASVAVEGVSMRAIDALAAQGGRIEEAIGPSIAIRLDARETEPNQGSVTASVESARLKLGFRGTMDENTLRSAGEEGLDLTWDPPPGFVDGELAAFLPPGTRVTTAKGAFEVHARGISIHPKILSGDFWEDSAAEIRASLPGATYASEGLAPMTIGRTVLTAKLSPGMKATFSLATPLDSGVPGRIAVEGSAEGTSFDVKVAVEGVSTAPIDALAGQDGDLVVALGPTLTLNASAHGEGPKVTGTAEVTTEKMSLRLSAEREGDRIRATGDQGVFLTTQSFASIDRYLPAGAGIAGTGPGPAVEFAVREISFVLPPDATAAKIVESLACDLSLKLGPLTYADASTRSAHIDLSVRDCEARTRVAPGKPLATTVAANVSTGPDDAGGRLDASATVPDPWFFLRGEDAKVPPVDADVRFTGLPVALLDSLAGKPGIATGLLGERADLEVKAAAASADAGTFRAKLTSPSTSIGVAARLDQGVLVAVDEPALDVAATLTQGWLDALLGSSTPPGAKIGLVDAKQPLRVVVAGLRFPLPTGEMNAEALANASMRAEFTVPDIAYSDPKTSEAKVPAVVRGLKITADLAPGSLPSAAVTARIDGEPAGEIHATIRALDPPAMLAEADGLERFRVALDVSAKSVPTGLVDALADQAGLLLDVLGATIDVALHSDGLSQSDGTFTASMESPQAKVTCDRGGLKDGILYLEKVGGNKEAVLAKAGLTPLFSERVVGSLVPMMADLKQPPGTPPVSVSVEELRMPLDADLSKLDAIVRVNLGKVTYKLLPGLEGVLGGGEAKVVDVPEIRVPIVKGVASYAGLPIRIGGKDYPFKGTFNLVDKSFKMETEVPLSALGKKVSDRLDSYREFLDPNLLVPLELRGTWSSPKLRVGDDFLKRVAEDALKRQGGSLLDGLLKKKKK